MPGLRASVEERLRYYSVEVPGGCWEWRGYVDKARGYGQLSINGKKREAYRVAYELWSAIVPAGLDLDHLCRNRLCINPAHLEPVTRGENCRRGFGACGLNHRKTHCKNGHPFDYENTYTANGTRRKCRACTNESVHRYSISPKGIANKARREARRLERLKNQSNERQSHA